MRKLFIQNTKLVIAALCCSAVLISCSKWDDFRKYTESGEIVYTGKMDSAVVFGGKNRVRLVGKIKGDPNIVKAKIYWNDMKDSMIYDLPSSGSVRVFDQTFAVDEGTKNFTIYTIDKFGNRSVAVVVPGTSYGSLYRKKISNRLINNIAVVTNPLKSTINWEPMDLSTGAQYTEILYRVGGIDKVAITPVTTDKTELVGFNSTTTKFNYRTVFKPNPTAIDTFAVAFVQR